MGVEICRKIKALMLIGMLAVAEARNMEALPRWRSSETTSEASLPEIQAQPGTQQVRGSALKQHADIVWRHVDAMMADSKFREQAKHIAKQMEALAADQKLREKTKLLTKQVEVMTANPHVQEQAKLIVQQVAALKDGPKMREQAEAFVKQVEAMKANPHLKRQTNLFEEELEAMMANPKFQQMKAATADPNLQEHINTLTSDPAFQEQAQRLAKHAETMMADPEVKAFAEQMKTKKAEPIAQEHAKRIAEQMEVLKADTELQEQATLFAKQMEGLVTDATIQNQMKQITAELRVLMDDPKLQERAQLIAKQVDQLEVSKTQLTRKSAGNMVDSLVRNLSGALFDRALKVLPRNTFAPAITRAFSWNSPRKTSVPIMAQKEKAAIMIKEESVAAKAKNEKITVMAAKEREGNDIQDALAGLTVAFSLLSKAIACSSIVGVSPLVGLWSAVVMGVSAPLLGSRPGVISGTAAVVTVPLSQLVAARGTDYIAPAILLASALEIAFGALQLSKYTVLVTDAVLAGFLNALGIILFESQGKIFTKAPDQAAAVGIAAVCVVIVQFLPKLTKAVPSSLVGLIVATGVGIAGGWKLEKLVDKAGPATFAGGLASLPTPIDFGKVAGQLTNPEILAFVVPAAFTIAFISILETLLAARVVDELKAEAICTFTPEGTIECFSDDGEEENLDVPTKSVLALGTGQFISACLGGFGGCGLIPQTVLNIKSGGGGALSSTAYAASMATFVLLLAPAVGQITSPALAGIFLTVAYDTVQWEATANTVKAALPGNSANPREARIELVALITAGVVCYKVDAALGIVAGVAVEQALRRLPGGDE